MQKKQKNILIVVFAVVILLSIGIVGIISFSDLSFLKTSAVEELTFDCNDGADLKSEEICGGWRHRHTYLFDSPRTASGIWGTVTIWGSSHHTLRPTVYMDFLIGGTWSTKMSWTMDANSYGDGKVNSFSVYFAPVTIEGFRFCTGEYGSQHSPYIHGSSGTVLVEGATSTTYRLTVHTTPPNCYVSLDGAVMESGSNGYVVFEDVESGTHDIIVSKTSYITIHDEITISNDRSVSYVLDQIIPETNTILYYTNPENVGSVLLNEQTYTNGQTSEEPGGTYSLYAENCSGYEFERWSVTGDLVLYDEDLQNAFVSISGDGSIKAWYIDIDEPPTPGFNICALIAIICVILIAIICVFSVLRKKKHI